MGLLGHQGFFFFLIKLQIRSNEKVLDSILLNELLENNDTIGAFGFYHSIVVKFLSKGIQLIDILNNYSISSFCSHHLYLDLLYWSRTSSFVVTLLKWVPNILGSSQEYTLISGIIEFHNHTIIMESSSSHVSNWGSPSFGPVPMRWLIFPFPFNMLHTSWDYLK